MRPEALARLAAAAFAMALATALGACSTGGGAIKKPSAASEKADAARVHTELGQKYMQQGKLEIALDNLNKALSYDSDYADAHTVIAVLYERIGDVKQAEEHYRRAAQLKPKGGNELNNYGAFLCKIGRYDESTEYFERAVADPFYNTPDVALTNEGTCLLKGGKNDAAEAALRKAAHAHWISFYGQYLPYEIVRRLRAREWARAAKAMGAFIRFLPRTAVAASQEFGDRLGRLAN